MINDLSANNRTLTFLNQPVASVAGLSKQQLNKISKALGEKVFNLVIENIPEKYEARLLANSIADLVQGEMSTLRAKVLGWKRGFGKSPATMKADFNGTVINIAIFGKVGDIYASAFPAGEEILISGEVSTRSVIPGFVNPDIFKFDEEWKVLLSGFVPVYKKISGVSQLFMLRTVKVILQKMKEFGDDWMPAEIIKGLEFPPFLETVLNIHFPIAGKSIDELNGRATHWHRRLAFDKLFFFQFGALKERLADTSLKGRNIEVHSQLSENVEKSLPFALTYAQKRVLEEIRNDLRSVRPMNRLLQGDVGSGKTAVMILSGLDVISSGYKTVIMAPTEILAVQHFNTISKNVPESLKIELFLGGVTGKKKKAQRAENAAKADFIIGTHALFENMEFMNDIGLVIIDEQHRFGVSQRMSLQNKAMNPDVLIVSATPIPRSLALTVYGSTDISVIDEMPPGRKPIVTRHVKHFNRNKVFDHVVEIIEKNNEKGYWVCPLVEESEKIDLKHVEGVFEEFRAVLGERVFLIHGKMKGDEKSAVIEKLKSGVANLLVSTIVVEVGVDVTDASFMVIENAERFGLAQLHQLRGRVGRGEKKSFCALISSEEVGGKADKRLESIAKTENGFKIAEYDLKTRGPGAMTGLEQSGFRNDPYFLLAAVHGDLVERAGSAVKKIFAGKNIEMIKYLEKVFDQFFKESFNRFKTG
jgi:ATP-dependent DNA helicase RecG